MTGGRSRSEGAQQSCSTRARGIASGLRCFSLAAATAISMTSQVGWAETRGDVRIVMPSVIQVETATETPLPIRVAPHSAIPKRAMVLIRGLPSTVALSEGRLFESGVWGVPVADVDRLRLTSPTNAVGKSNFSVSVVTFAGDILAQATASLQIIPPQQLSRASREVNTVNATPTEPTNAEEGGGAPAAKAEAEKPAAKGSPTGEALERVMLYMQKGQECMNTGNVSAARMFFTRAANEGWADGALALAATYDPAELGSLPVAGGIRPDPSLAKKWYEKAVALGSKVARTRIQRLSER